MEIINLKRLLNNIRIIEESSKSKVLPVLKANCYNLGYEVVEYLINNKITSICLNDICEVIKLEENLKNNFNRLTNIIVFNSIPRSNYHYLYNFQNVVLSINNLNDIKNLNEYCYLSKIRVNLQIDTGMNRVGINSKDEFKKILEVIKYNPKFKIYSIYSHIANDINKQKEIFDEYLKIIDDKTIYTHLYASKYYNVKPKYDFVRIGLNLYGDGSDSMISQVIKVISKPINIIKLSKHSKLGYNSLYDSDEEIIAVLPLGYYNGFDRRLVGYKVYYQKKYYQIVGSICMNHMFIKCDNTITLNSEFELIGDNNKLIDMAKYLDTVSSEIITRLNIDNRKYIK